MPLTETAALRKDRTTAPMLEHRHFAFIAAVIGAMNGYRELDDRQEIARCFADACARTNPRFDRARFLRAACNREH